MTKIEFLESLAETFNEAITIAEKKNADYASTEDPFRNFKNAEAVGVSLEKGIMVRIMDKVSRISNLLEAEAQVKDEKIEDTLVDLINYTAILKAYLESKK